MNDQRIDFSSLDPARNAKRWESRIEHIANRAAENCRGKLTVMGQLIVWTRPMLAIAASIALVGWISLLTFGEQSSSVKLDPTTAITTWAARDELPSTETVISTLGGSIDQK
jgi:hypothetical protein